MILAAPNRCEWVETEHALAAGGLVRVALIPRLHPRELAHIAADCEPFAVIVEDRWVASRAWTGCRRDTGTVIVIGSAAGLPGHVVEFGQLIDSDRAARAAGPGSRRPRRGLVHVGLDRAAQGRPLHPPHLRRLDPQHPPRDAAAGRRRRPAHGADQPLERRHRARAQRGRRRQPAAPRLRGRGGARTRSPRHGVTVLPLVPTQINWLVDHVDPRRAAHERMGSVRLVPYAGSAIAPDRLARPSSASPTPWPSSTAAPRRRRRSPTSRPRTTPWPGPPTATRLASAGRTHPAHRGPDRRTPRASAGSARSPPRRAGHRRLLAPAGGDAPRSATPTAGFAPATSAISTARTSSSSSTARRR